LLDDATRVVDARDSNEHVRAKKFRCRAHVEVVRHPVDVLIGRRNASLRGRTTAGGRTGQNAEMSDNALDFR